MLASQTTVYMIVTLCGACKNTFYKQKQKTEIKESDIIDKTKKDHIKEKRTHCRFNTQIVHEVHKYLQSLV